MVPSLHLGEINSGIHMYQVTFFFGCSCGFGFEQKFCWIDGFGEKKVWIGGFAYPYPTPSLKLCKNKKKRQDCSISTKNKKAIPTPMFHYHSLIPWGSFLGSTRRKGRIISGLIWKSFQGWGSFRGQDHFEGCTAVAQRRVNGYSTIMYVYESTSHLSKISLGILKQEILNCLSSLGNLEQNFHSLVAVS